MGTYKQRLKESPKAYSNGTDIMYCNVATSGVIVINFNAKFFSYKTYDGYNRKAKELIKKYNLVETIYN